MSHQHRDRSLGCALALVIVSAACVGLAGCGGSSGDATALLRQTFTGNHRVDSGNLGFNLILEPSGSSTLRGPISLSLRGPFQSLGRGRLPQSAFNVSLTGMGGGGSVTITSTGASGYLTFAGASYRLPQATFQRLESSFSALGSAPGTSRSGLLGRLGIQPEHWLVNPRVVGDEAIDGTDTTHIHAGVNFAALLSDLSTFLQRAALRGGSAASSFPSGISAATRSRIAGEVRNPTFDVWTGKTDRTLRRLQIKMRLALSGQTSASLGGARSVAIGITLQYANLNQPQAITAPVALRPYSEFQGRLQVLLQAVRGALSSK
jgi:hypothetical protein